MGFERLKGGKGGGRGKAKNPSMSAIKRKRRRPQDFAGFDVSLTDAGAAATTITSTGSQTYTVPRGVDSLTIELVGGGGGGGSGQAGRGGAFTEGGGGGSGAKIVLVLDEVTPGSTLTFNIGEGGEYGGFGGVVDHGEDGGDTTFTYDSITYTAGGGAGGESHMAFGSAPDGSGGTATRSSGSEGTLTNGNAGAAKNTTGAAGSSVATTGSYGAGGVGQVSGTGQASGTNGFVKIS